MNGEVARNIIQSFRQGGEGNCVSIAIIKAGIEVFGVGGLFRVTERQGAVTVITKDGKEMELSQIELEQARDGSHFICLEDENIFNYANFAFAVMAKYAQQDGNDSFGPNEMTFEQAIGTLNNGENYLEGPRWLGLKSHVKNIGRKYRWQYPGCVGASAKHCFFMSYGYEDQYGTPDSTGDFLDRLKIRHVFRLCLDASH